MRVIETKVYTFDELSEEAKEKVREWFITNDDFSYHAETVIDDAKQIGALMGIDIKRVFYSGFYSQGDGACFEGDYSYKKGSVKAVKEYAPLDKELHKIVEAIAKLQRQNFYRLTATVKQRGYYMHERCTEISVTDCDNKTEQALAELLRDYMQWIYSQLEKENEYQSSEEVVDENIKANEYEFTEEGEIV